MPKKLLQKFMPNPERVRNMKGLGLIGRSINKPYLWHLSRKPVARAFLFGLFWMSIPMPSQMIASAITAVLFRCNLPLSVALVWISNPFTMPPIFYFNYLVGTWILGEPAQESLGFEMSWDWILSTLNGLWMPLYLGSAVVGLVLGLISFWGIHIFWRWHVLKAWRLRSEKRQDKFRKEIIKTFQKN